MPTAPGSRPQRSPSDPTRHRPSPPKWRRLRHGSQVLRLPQLPEYTITRHIAVQAPCCRLMLTNGVLCLPSSTRPSTSSRWSPGSVRRVSGQDADGKDSCQASHDGQCRQDGDTRPNAPAKPLSPPCRHPCIRADTYGASVGSANSGVGAGGAVTNVPSWNWVPEVTNTVRTPSTTTHTGS